MGKKRDLGRLPHTNFSVDYWRRDPAIRLRFLTHCHGGTSPLRSQPG
jgi:hypothetical protein